MPLSPNAPEKKTIEVLGHKMTYVEMGEGDPIVFQHGNPTSSYLWRNVMPHLAAHGRCIAVDLIGMGGSDKLSPSGADRYTFAEHSRFLDAAWKALGVTQNVAMVLHDWGSALGFYWAQRHAHQVQAIAYMEGMVAPLKKWDYWPEAAREVFQAMRSPAGEDMVLEKNIFVENILPASVLRDLTPEEMDHYRAPYLDAGESRRPTLTWPRQIPIEGDPADVEAIVKSYAAFLAESQTPKLFVNADPGMILIGKQREMCRAWPNQTEVTVKGLHFIQEDSPDEIGVAVADFISGLRG